MKANTKWSVQINIYWTGAAYIFTTTGDLSLPVELAYFKGVITKKGVELSWSTNSEIENLGFQIFRSSRDEHPVVIASYLTESVLNGQGSTTKTTDYVFTDIHVRDRIEYTYLISDIDYSGKETIHAEFALTVKVPEKYLSENLSFELSNSYPNPFNAGIVIPFNLNKNMFVSMKLYDITGREVLSILNQDMSVGSYRHRVNTESLNSGIYFLSIHTDDAVRTQEIALIK